ncbi:MAG: phosphonopyruvate decarboxylase [Planctomycetota bacterium]|jgi:phosphonopyruvate decarboxylase
MISAEAFVERARARGHDFFSGVPCSYLTPFIDTVIDDDRLTYVPSASEGDAVAIAAGAVLGGRRAVVMMQNSGLGNAVNPLTSLTWPFRIPVLLLVTHRGETPGSDEPQHELMGQVTTALLEQMQVPWAPFPDADDRIDAALDRADVVMRDTQRPFALVVRRGAIAPRVPQDASQAPADPVPVVPVQEFGAGGSDPRPTRRDALHRIVERTPEASTVVIGSTGHIGRGLFAESDRPNHLYMVGSMGCASALGLGLALARPDLRVIVVDGDGAAVMRLGNLVTLGAHGGPNLVHIVFNNGVHETTGGQATTSPALSFADIARSCGYEPVLRGRDVGLLDTILSSTMRSRPAFGEMLIRPGAPERLPRPDRRPDQVRARLMQHIGSVPCAC